MPHLTVGQVARIIGTRPTDITNAFPLRQLRDDLCPVVAGRRQIPERYVPMIEAALRRAGKLPTQPKLEASNRLKVPPSHTGPTRSSTPASSTTSAGESRQSSACGNPLLVPAIAPGRNGRNAHISFIHRITRDGARAPDGTRVRLGTARLPCEVSTESAVRRWFAAINGLDPTIPTTTQNDQRHRDAEVLLQANRGAVPTKQPPLPRWPILRPGWGLPPITAERNRCLRPKRESAPSIEPSVSAYFLWLPTASSGGDKVSSTTFCMLHCFQRSPLAMLLFPIWHNCSGNSLSDG